MGTPTTSFYVCVTLLTDHQRPSANFLSPCPFPYAILHHSNVFSIYFVSLKKLLVGSCHVLNKHTTLILDIFQFSHGSSGSNSQKQVQAKTKISKIWIHNWFHSCFLFVSALILCCCCALQVSKRRLLLVITKASFWISEFLSVDTGMISQQRRFNSGIIRVAGNPKFSLDHNQQKSCQQYS